MENKPTIIIPISVVEAAYNKGEPRAVFEMVKIEDIIAKMKEPFLNKDNGNANPKNPNLLIEKFNGQMQIFSYRNSDFKGLFNSLNSSFNKTKNVSELFDSKARAKMGAQ